MLLKPMTLLGLTLAAVWSTGAVASARESRETVGSLVAEIARSTDAALLHLQDDLIRRGRWKPRGYDGKLWSSLAKLEKYGDSLDKVYRRRGDLETLGEVTRAMTKQLAGVYHWERMTYVPPAVHRDIRRAEHAVAILDRWANDSRRPGRSPAYGRPDRDRGFERPEGPWRRGYGPEDDDYRRGYIPRR